MCSFTVIELYESVEIIVKLLNGLINICSESNLVKLFEQGSVQALTGAVCPWMADSGKSMIYFQLL